MNKQMQVALAMVLAAAAGSAAAQSNVTVYGTIDTSVGRGYKSDASA
ncbi:porin [Comamonas aquatica]|nr:porin [Comamonas aquatica]